MTETLTSIRINPAGKWIESAGEGPVGMDATTLLIEENACAIVLGVCAQDGATSLCMLRDEFRRRHAKASRKPQDFVGTDADHLVVTATRAGVALIGEHTVAFESKIDPGKSVAVRHDLGSGRQESGGLRDRFCSLELASLRAHI